MSSTARKMNDGLHLRGKTVVVSGGSQGIGAGVAIRFAQAGANVFVVGRSRERLESVVEAARKAAPSTEQRMGYVSADLGLVSGMHAAVDAIKRETNGHVDYLVQTQGGTPHGRHELNAEGIDAHFAIQVLSRFVLAYRLAVDHVLTDTAISVMSPGGSQTEFDLDDIELKHKDAGRFSLLAKQGSRNAVIADAGFKALQSRFPALKFFHIYPGIVQTNVLVNQGWPFPIRELFTYVVGPVVARTVGNTVESYAEIPVFLAANERRDTVVDREGFFLDNKLKKVEVSPYAREKSNQDAVFKKLVGYWDAHASST